jgi:hypothetical protein
VNFEAAVLERDGAEVVRAISAQLFGKKHNMGFVNRPKVSGEVVEIAKSIIIYIPDFLKFKITGSKEPVLHINALLRVKQQFAGKKRCA